MKKIIVLCAVFSLTTSSLLAMDREYVDTGITRKMCFSIRLVINIPQAKNVEQYVDRDIGEYLQDLDCIDKIDKKAYPPIIEKINNKDRSFGKIVLRLWGINPDIISEEYFDRVLYTIKQSIEKAEKT